MQTRVFSQATVVVALAACSREATVEPVKTVATNAVSSAMAVADAATGTSAPAGPPVPTATSAPVTTATTGTKPDPLIRVTTWTCDEQDCERAPRLAYDNLPAARPDGNAIAFVEERDAWGHRREVGVHIVDTAGHTTFLPTLAAKRELREEHQKAIDRTNAALRGKDYRALYWMDPAPAEQRIGGKWIPGDDPQAETRVTYTAMGVSATFTYDHGEYQTVAGSAFTEVVVTVFGKEVLRRHGKTFKDKAGCSSRALVVDGVRPDRKVIGFTFTNGTTGHNCDGKAEPQVHHVLHWE